MSTRWFWLIAAAGLLPSQPQTTAPHGTVERIRVHGKTLEGNLEGDSPDREVFVYLPPSYQSGRTRRYPVIYLLHGFTDDPEHWWGVKQHFVNVPAVMDKYLASSGAREMIVVMPNAFTAWQGSMYSNSATTGDWEAFVSQEMVGYIDGRYRTIADAGSRGLAGHSMGGYGTIRIGMKYPEMFSAIYALSPCCMAANTFSGQRSAGLERAAAVRSPEEGAKADFGTKAMLASAAAWSPNPAKPPLYFDLPWENGELKTAIAAKWTANAPLAMIDQYVTELRKLRAIGMDAGEQDQPIGSTVVTLHEILTAYKIPHEFEMYQGNHVNRVAERLETKTLPFFGRELGGRAAGK